jgi:Tol biopolymer transport system component
MKTVLTAKVAIIAFSLAAVVNCEEPPTEIEGPYVPPQVKGYDGRRLIWKPADEYEKQCYEPDFSPDGTKVVASYRDGIWGRDADVAILDLNTAEFKVVLEGNSAKRPRWSPTGEWIAYESQHPAHSRTLWLVRPDGSENQKVELGINEVYVPYWGPDGDKIYFVGHYVRREPLYALWYDLRTKEIHVLRKPEELSHNVAIPSPGGEKVALGLMERWGRHGHVVLALVGADGSGLRVLWSEINDSPGGVGNPRDWSPDGKYVLIRYDPPHGTGDSLWTYELKTAAVRQLTMCPPDEDVQIVPHGSWGPNGDIVFGTEWGWLYLIKAPE